MDDDKEIETIVNDVFRNWSAMRPHANDALYRADDKTVLFDVAPLQDVGWESQKRRLEEMFRDFSAFAMTPNDDLRVHRLDRVAWATCTWDAEIRLKGGEVRQVRGRMTMILEQHDGRWLVVHDHVSLPVQ